MKIDHIEALEAKMKEREAKFRKKICVCAGAGCLSSGGQQVLDRLRDTVKQGGMDQEIAVVPTGCMGACNQGPLIKVLPDNLLFEKFGAEEVADLVKDRLSDGKAVTGPFFDKQLRVVLENCGRINPESIDEYIASGGYRALFKALVNMSRAEVIDEIVESGLRGRGGAGYPTGKKWRMVHDYAGDAKYVVCNGDEGDPGAFMDRSVLEGDPHRVIEGMIIAGYAVGAQKGYLYVRAEYPLAIQRFDNAIKEARKHQLLGNSIFDTAFAFDIEIRVGAGAFVCGEETALIASIEGKRGTPRPRPPYPAEFGLWGKPTLINNVETFACIVPIVLRGAPWFAAIGTQGSKGTKVFALAGKVNNTGLVEVPMGMTLREIIFDIGGGIPGGKFFKAAQTGGPSGGCIPKEHLDVKMDYDNLVQIGSIMGSGGLIVMDEDSCMVDVARYFMEFCMDESCGKCVPCRVGTRQMHDLLVKICKGDAGDEDLALLEELAPMVKETSLCGLGMTAPNPLLSTLRYFRDEYLAHIRDKRCPAGVCGKKGALACR